MDLFKNQQMNNIKRDDARNLRDNNYKDDQNNYSSGKRKGNFWLYFVLGIIVLALLSFIF
ncbi:hypothetical protein [Anaerorhabdus sp.]|jgi:hypothetical protein|uniref:hypothetical protein n=1 Tax=Anaerorhabdus sp. TaxID=1872524 RepID=UPI002FC8BC69